MAIGRAILLGAIILLGTCGSPAHAQDPDQLTLRYKGRPGIWFSSQRAKAILKDVQAYRETQATLLPAMQLKLEMADLRGDYLRRALSLSEQAASMSIANVAAAEEQAREAIEDRDALMAGQPVVWLLVGVGLTVLGAVLIL